MIGTSSAAMWRMQSTLLAEITASAPAVKALNASPSRSSAVTAPSKSMAAVTKTRDDPSRTAGTAPAMQTTISTPAASAAADSSAVEAVTCASRRPCALSATMSATVTVRSASRPL